MGRFCLFAYTGLTNRFRHARGLLQLSKSSQAHTIRKKQRVGFGKLFIGWRTKAIFFSKWNQNVGSALRKWNDKVKKKSKISPVDVIGGWFKIETEPHFKLVVLSAMKVN